MRQVLPSSSLHASVGYKCQLHFLTCSEKGRVILTLTDIILKTRCSTPVYHEVYSTVGSTRRIGQTIKITLVVSFVFECIHAQLKCDIFEGIYCYVNYETCLTRPALLLNAGSDGSTSLIVTQPSGDSQEGWSPAFITPCFSQNSRLFSEQLRSPAVWRFSFTYTHIWEKGEINVTRMPSTFFGTWEIISNANLEGYMIALGKALTQQWFQILYLCSMIWMSTFLF